MQSTKTCIACSKEFTCYEHYEGERKFCSKECRYNNGGYPWKGDEAVYVSKHAYISKKKGKPRYCEHCKRTDRKRYGWANIDHKYSRNPDDYIRLCTQCHKIYDNEHFYKPKFDVKKVKELHNKGLSMRAIGRELGITHSTVKRYL